MCCCDQGGLGDQISKLEIHNLPQPSGRGRDIFSDGFFQKNNTAYYIGIVLYRAIGQGRLCNRPDRVILREILAVCKKFLVQRNAANWIIVSIAM